MNFFKIKINHEILSDSPFCNSNKELFDTTHSAKADLIQDIKNGTHTCYLVSGYRGAGKSSFIKQVELEIKNKSELGESDSKQNKEVVFVHTNFSRYGSQTFLLRNLIRGLYLEIVELSSFKELKSTELKKNINQRTAHLLEELYEKTFYDTSRNYSKVDKKEIITIFNIDIKALLGFLLPSFLFAFVVLNWIFELITSTNQINIIVAIISSIFSIQKFIEIKKSITHNKIEQQDFIRKSMYDNEIADHHFFELLNSLQKDYKIIFVLDELDKVDDSDLDKLLKEIKPYLVCGTASFIAVSGQNLYYKYLQSKSIDDAVLSSIFSKFIHIPLLSREEFYLIFKRLDIRDVNLTNEQEELLVHFIDSLIFESKRIPRKFISLIRQNLIWEDNCAYLKIDESKNQLKIFTQILDVIDRIDDKEIATEGFDEALHNYFIMQLFIRSHKILFSKKFNFSQKEIID